MGEKEGAREGEGLRKREQGACSACSTFFRGLERNQFLRSQSRLQGRGFKALVKWFLRKRMYLSTFTWGCTFLQGDAGGLEIDYVDLDFQVPPVCTVALPIQQQPQQPSR